VNCPESKLNRAGEALPEGDDPNQFNFDPDGNFLCVRNQRREQITLFPVERKTGLLIFTGDARPITTKGSVGCTHFFCIQ
jgi:6-phosphogluconolactonase